MNGILTVRWPERKACWRLPKKSDDQPLARFKEQLRRTAEEYRPSFLARYLLDLARDFNKFYHNCPVLTAGGSLKEARLLLIEGVRIVLHNGLELLGIEAPEEM